MNKNFTNVDKRFNFYHIMMYNARYNKIENQKDWEVSPIPPKHRLEIGNILMIKVISRNEESNKLS